MFSHLFSHLLRMDLTKRKADGYEQTCSVTCGARERSGRVMNLSGQTA